VIRKTERARRVMLKSLAHDGVNTRSVLTNYVSLVVREVVVACPAWMIKGVSKVPLVSTYAGV
jgi:hypothetical protein